jgi:hypothetical protein
MPANGRNGSSAEEAGDANHRIPITLHHGSTGQATTAPRQHLDDDTRSTTAADAADAKRTRIVSVTEYLFSRLGTVSVFPL